MWSDDSFFYDRRFVVSMYEYIEINNGKIKYYEDGPNGNKIFFEGKYERRPEIPSAINYTVLGVSHELQKDDLK